MQPVLPVSGAWLSISEWSDLMSHALGRDSSPVLSWKNKVPGRVWRPVLRKERHRSKHLVAARDPKNSILSNLIQTFQSWIAGDRIRIAASHGRSLSIQPGDRIFIEDRNYLVQTRTLADDADPQCTRLVYDLLDQGSDQTRTLEVVLRKDGTGIHQAVLKDGDNASAICDADITIL